MESTTVVEFIVRQLDVLNRERQDKLIDAETFFRHKIALIEEAKKIEKRQIEYVFEWLTTNNYLTDLKETMIEDFNKFKKKQNL
jgi:hypothetical protein